MEIWKGLVPTDAIDTVQERVNRVTLRAIKHDFPAPALIVGSESVLEIAPGLSVRMAEVTIEAPGPLRLGDWRFIGVVSAVLENGREQPFVTFVPGVDTFATGNILPASVNWCDHCNLMRRRNDTYLVSNVTEGIKQVGSSCLKDFTGHDATAMVAYINALDTLRLSNDEVVGWASSATRYYDPKAVLRIAARIVSRDGYVNRDKAIREDITSTGEMVRRYLSASAVIYADFDRTYPDTAEADRLVEATLKACSDTLRIDNVSGWGYDVSRLATSQGIQWRHVGMVASAIILGMRAQEQKARAEGDSNFIGQKGERITVPVKVTLKRSYDGAYGPSYIIRMTANKSDDLLWFTSVTPATEAIEEGFEGILTGTVKNHELDRRSERPTTVVTRCKISA